MLTIILSVLVGAGIIASLVRLSIWADNIRYDLNGTDTDLAKMMNLIAFPGRTFIKIFEFVIELFFVAVFFWIYFEAGRLPKANP